MSGGKYRTWVILSRRAAHFSDGHGEYRREQLGNSLFPSGCAFGSKFLKGKADHRLSLSLSISPCRDLDLSHPGHPLCPHILMVTSSVRNFDETTTTTTTTTLSLPLLSAVSTFHLQRCIIQARYRDLASSRTRVIHSSLTFL